jgi:hypothetical protein
MLNVHEVHDVRQMDIHMAEPLIPEPSLVKVEIAIGKLKGYKSLGTDQIPTEFIKAGGETLYSELHTYLSYMEYGGITTAVEGIYCCTKTDCNNYQSPSYQLPTKF